MFEQMFHHSQAIKLLVDPDTGHIRDANAAACRFYGLDQATLSQRRISDLNTLPEARIRQEMSAARESQRNHFRFQHRLSDESLRDVEVYSSPLSLKGKTYLLSIIHDVTARNDNEHELAVLRDVVENLPVGIYRSTMDQQGQFLSVNQEMVRIAEADSVETLLATPVRDLYADKATREHFIEGLQQAEDWYSQTVKLCSMKGKVGHYRVSVRKQQDDNGTVFIDGILEDITHLRAAEQSQQQLFEIIEATPAIIGISRPEGELIYLNTAGREILGLGPHDALDSFKPRKVHSKDSFETLTKKALPTALEKGQWSGEMCFRTPGGEEIPVQTTLIAHYGDDGELDRISAVSVDVSAQKQRQMALERLAYKDSLTAVFNRRGFMRALRNAVADARRQGTPLSIIMADLDHFKPINDTHGHPVGDEILQKLMPFLQGGRRQLDQVGRLGGEEFGIILPGAGLEDAVAIAERIRATLAHQPIETQAGTIPITLSLGVSELDGDKRSGPILIREADKALYEAKHAGRNQVRSR
nr:sensor domain-containing diguanylate cyclase [Natronospira proteinivora]